MNIVDVKYAADVLLWIIEWVFFLIAATGAAVWLLPLLARLVPLGKPDVALDPLSRIHREDSGAWTAFENGGSDE